MMPNKRLQPTLAKPRAAEARRWAVAKYMSSDLHRSRESVASFEALRSWLPLIVLPVVLLQLSLA